MIERFVEEIEPVRLDAWLAEEEPDLSRSRWQALIKEGLVTVNGDPVKKNCRVRDGDRVAWHIPSEPAEPVPQPEAIPLNILYEDHDLIVVNKPAGLVVHPAAGNETGTLVNALLHHCTDLAGIGGERRPGIIHRLDKDTSGVMVAAKNETAMNELSRQFRYRETEKEYLALVWGAPPQKRGTIRTTIGRHPIHRKKMAVGVRNGRNAVSHYELLETFDKAALVRVRIETGRTHQIRVHLAHLKTPVIGDMLYGRPRKATVRADRQMLHAAKLSFAHPKTGKRMLFEAPLPEDFQKLLERLRKIPVRQELPEESFGETPKTRF